jgi:tetratricopeptide (TPR) repeat protein
MSLFLGAALCQGCTSVPDPESLDGSPVSGIALDQPANLQEQNTEQEKAIRAYREHLARFPDSPDYDTITRRLADLLLERASDPQRETETSYREAIAAYEYLLDRSPGDTELMYQLSRAYEESGQPRRALEMVDRLMAQTPDQTPWLRSDALFRQGELLFDADEFARAETAYTAVIALGVDAPAFEQALYKLGWSLYMQGKYAEALDPFFAYLETLPGPLSGGAVSNANLSPVEQEQLTELPDVISNCFVHLGGVQAAEDFFASRESREYEREIYIALARWYEERQQVSRAGETWLFIAQRAPFSRDTPILTGRAVTLYQAAGFERLAFVTRRHFVDAYGPRSEFWLYHETAGYPDELRLMEISLRKLGNHYHQQSIDAPGQGYAQVAEHYYRDYLSWFAEKGAAHRIQFQLAEVLAYQGRYSEAYDYYADLAWGRGEETLAVAAALGALQANAKLVAEAGPDRDPSLTRRGRNDAVRFVMTFPDHEAAPKLLARIGGELLDQSDRDALANILGSILIGDNGTQEELMLVAWTLNARAAHAGADYPGAVEAYRSALDYTPEADERRAALSTGLASALLDAGRQSVEQHNWEMAGRRFEEAAIYATDDELRQSAHYAKASVHLAQSEWEEATGLLNTYRQEYPDGPHQAEVSRKLAYAYEQNGTRHLAAAEYYSLGQNRQQPLELRRQAILQAVELYDQGGDASMAVKTREYYVEQFPDPAERSLVLMQELASLYAIQGNATMQRHWLAAIIELDERSGTANTRQVAARAALGIGELSLGRFRRIRLVSPLQANLTKKIKLMEQALSDFERAAGYGVASVSSAATYHMASMYDELGRTLLTSERPAGLTEDEREEYETLLAEQAAPFTQQAMEMYDLNVSRAPIDRSDPWVQRSVEQLDALRNSSAGLPGA